MDSMAKDLTADSTEAVGMNLPEHPKRFTLPKYNSNRNIIYQKFKSNQYDAIMKNNAHQYWIEKKHQYAKENTQAIHWDAQFTTFKSLEGTRQKTMSKWFSE